MRGWFLGGLVLVVGLARSRAGCVGWRVVLGARERAELGRGVGLAPGLLLRRRKAASGFVAGLPVSRASRG